MASANNLRIRAKMVFVISELTDPGEGKSAEGKQSTVRYEVTDTINVETWNILKALYESGHLYFSAPV